jgi:hypothetical protein
MQLDGSEKSIILIMGGVWGIQSQSPVEGSPGSPLLNPFSYYSNLTTKTPGAIVENFNIRPASDLPRDIPPAEF